MAVCCHTWSRYVSFPAHESGVEQQHHTLVVGPNTDVLMSLLVDMFCDLDDFCKGCEPWGTNLSGTGVVQEAEINRIRRCSRVI